MRTAIQFLILHNIYSPAKVTELDIKIQGFMEYLRLTFPEIIISPKLHHMMEDRMILFIRWGAECGFSGEQGGESIHAKFSTLTRN